MLYFYSMIEKRKVGRPKKKISDLPENWEENILDLYKQGGCDIEARAELDGMHEGLWYRLLQDEEEFSQVIKKGRLLAEAWWRRMSRLYLKAGEINTGLYALNMRNRFKWFDANRQGESIENIGEKLDKIAGALSRSDTSTD